MYQEIYIDVVFAANLLMDYLLLRLVGWFLRCRAGRRRCFAAAALGAFGSCLILCIPSENTPVLTVALHGFCALVMLRIGLKIQKGALLLKAFLMLYLTAFLCGGFWEAVSRERTLTIKVFLLCVFVVYTGSSAFLFAADSIRAGRRNIYPVTFGYQGRVQSAYGLYDSGNLLEDPIKRQAGIDHGGRTSCEDFAEGTCRGTEEPQWRSGEPEKHRDRRSETTLSVT